MYKKATPESYRPPARATFPSVPKSCPPRRYGLSRPRYVGIKAAPEQDRNEPWWLRALRLYPAASGEHPQYQCDCRGPFSQLPSFIYSFVHWLRCKVLLCLDTNWYFTTTAEAALKDYVFARKFWKMNPKVMEVDFGNSKKPPTSSAAKWAQFIHQKIPLQGPSSY